VGGASGCLHFQRAKEDGIARNQGFYWRYELKLREQESRLGLLAVASGACMAVRRQLFRQMTAAYGEDCILPLDVVSQGATFVHVPQARAVDRMASSQEGELATRSRMTLRNWQGTWAYPHLLNPFKSPGYAFALWSHKILRWCAPLFLATASLAVSLLAAHSLFYGLAAAGFAGFYLMALSGWWAQRRKLRWPLVHTAYSFLLANLGFALGLWRALRGEQIRKYKHD